MFIENKQITDVTVSVCREMLGVAIEKLNSASDESQPTDHIATIQVLGETQILIQVVACQKAANTISSAMFDKEADQLDEAEISDAVCEVVNMIGGNIKGILDCECDLTIPCFSREPDTIIADGTESVLFNLAGGTLQVICKEQNTVKSLQGVD